MEPSVSYSERLDRRGYVAAMTVEAPPLRCTRLGVTSGGTSLLAGRRCSTSLTQRHDRSLVGDTPRDVRGLNVSSVSSLWLTLCKANRVSMVRVGITSEATSRDFDRRRVIKPDRAVIQAKLIKESSKPS